MKITFPSQYASKLRDNLYMCLVPDEATLSPEYVATYGVHSTGFRDADEQLRDRRATVMIDVSTILNYYINGIDITIVNDKDILDIHRNITGYLKEWEYHLENDINIRVTEYAEYLSNLEDLNNAFYKMLTKTEYVELLPKQPTFFKRALSIKTNEDKDIVKPSYREQYGTVINTIRERKRFENN